MHGFESGDVESCDAFSTELAADRDANAGRM